MNLRRRVISISTAPNGKRPALSRIRAVRCQRLLRRWVHSCCWWHVWEVTFTRQLRGHPESAQSGVESGVSIPSQSPTELSDPIRNILMAYNEGNAPGFSAAMRFALKGLHKTVLWNPFRVRVRMVRKPGAAFIRIRGFSCLRLICTSHSGSITAFIKYNTFVVWGRPRTSFRGEPF